MPFVTTLEFDSKGFLATELRAGHEVGLFERVRDLSSPLASRRIDRAAACDSASRTECLRPHPAFVRGPARPPKRHGR